MVSATTSLFQDSLSLGRGGTQVREKRTQEGIVGWKGEVDWGGGGENGKKDQWSIHSATVKDGPPGGGEKSKEKDWERRRAGGENLAGRCSVKHERRRERPKQQKVG